MGVTCAFEQGLLSQEEFSDFARRAGGIWVEPLCPELEARIKQDWVDAHSGIPAIQDVSIDLYLGTYNDSVALMISHARGDFSAHWTEKISDYWFHYNSDQRIFVWNDGTFFTLSERGACGGILNTPGAYELGLLTAEDIGIIYILYVHRR